MDFFSLTTRQTKAFKRNNAPFIGSFIVVSIFLLRPDGFAWVAAEKLAGICFVALCNMQKLVDVLCDGERTTGLLSLLIVSVFIGKHMTRKILSHHQPVVIIPSKQSPPVVVKSRIVQHEPQAPKQARVNRRKGRKTLQAATNVISQENRKNDHAPNPPRRNAESPVTAPSITRSIKIVPNPVNSVDIEQAAKPCIKKPALEKTSTPTRIAKPASPVRTLPIVEVILPVQQESTPAKAIKPLPSISIMEPEKGPESQALPSHVKNKSSTRAKSVVFNPKPVVFNQPLPTNQSLVTPPRRPRKMDYQVDSWRKKATNSIELKRNHHPNGRIYAKPMLRSRDNLNKPKAYTTTRTQDSGDKLTQFLRELNLEEYRDKFAAEKLDLETLHLLSERDLECLDLPLGSRKRIHLALEQSKRRDNGYYAPQRRSAPHFGRESAGTHRHNQDDETNTSSSVPIALAMPKGNPTMSFSFSGGYPVQVHFPCQSVTPYANPVYPNSRDYLETKGIRSPFGEEQLEQDMSRIANQMSSSVLDCGE
mmetsp:Transcript_6152/g.9621  ORF Transcript_6152/g.9621 Transcript_6152/m.9621 type:complete len:535 (-) Transcript_6152:1980-3584(-)